MKRRGLGSECVAGDRKCRSVETCATLLSPVRVAGEKPRHTPLAYAVKLQPAGNFLGRAAAAGEFRLIGVVVVVAVWGVSRRWMMGL